MRPVSKTLRWSIMLVVTLGFFLANHNLKTSVANTSLDQAEEGSFLSSAEQAQEGWFCGDGGIGDGVFRPWSWHESGDWFWGHVACHVRVDDSQCCMGRSAVNRRTAFDRDGMFEHHGTRGIASSSTSGRTNVGVHERRGISAGGTAY